MQRCCNAQRGLDGVINHQKVIVKLLIDAGHTTERNLVDGLGAHYAYMQCI